MKCKASILVLVLALLFISESAIGTKKSSGMEINNASGITLTPTYLPEKIGTNDKPFIIKSNKDLIDYLPIILSIVSISISIGTIILTSQSHYYKKLDALIMLKKGYEENYKIMINNSEKLFSMSPLFQQTDITQKEIERLESEYKNLLPRLHQLSKEIEKYYSHILPDSKK